MNISLILGTRYDRLQIYSEASGYLSCNFDDIYGLKYSSIRFKCFFSYLKIIK